MARILLVDDDHDIRELGRALLAHAGHEAFVAASALDAVRFINENSIDVMITDVNMPSHSGFDLVRFVKSNADHANLTIAILTGRRERADIETALDLGVHDYIVKPLDPELFLKKITDLLNRRPASTSDIEDSDLASLKMNHPAKVSLELQIISISELGLLIRSNQKFEIGNRIEIESDLFEKIGIKKPAMRVFTSQLKPGSWETRVSFIGADEQTLTKIRAWIYANTLRNRSA